MFMTDLNSELSRCLGQSHTFSLAWEAAKETIPRKASSELNNTTFYSERKLIPVVTEKLSQIVAKPVAHHKKIDFLNQHHSRSTFILVFACRWKINLIDRSHWELAIMPELQIMQTKHSM